MGHYTHITVSVEETDVLSALLDEAVKRHLEGNLSDLSFGPVSATEWSVEGNSTWEPEGVLDFAEAVSARFPRSIVGVRIEWDNRDADEPGAVEYSYIGGQRCNNRETGLVPDDLAESVKRVRDALTGSGDLSAAALWLVDGLDGSRVPGPDADAAPRTVATVTVTDEWENDYSDLFAKVYDYSEVVEHDGDELLLATGWHDDRRLACSESIHAIIDRWIEHAEAATGHAYSREWIGPWGAYVLPYWDGKTTGIRSISDDGEGRGDIPFDHVIDALGLAVTVTWSDGTTD